MPEPASRAERDAKIEQLLLAGLDQYFAGQYDQAITVWTRALFIDRSHARARAYIERARSAQAERQRDAHSDGAAQRDAAAVRPQIAEEVCSVEAIVHGFPGLRRNYSTAIFVVEGLV